MANSPIMLAWIKQMGGSVYPSDCSACILLLISVTNSKYTSRIKQMIPVESESKMWSQIESGLRYNETFGNCGICGNRTIGFPDIVSLEKSDLDVINSPMRVPSVKKHVSERSLTLEQGVMYTLGEYTVDVGDKTLNVPLWEAMAQHAGCSAHSDNVLEFEVEHRRTRVMDVQTRVLKNAWGRNCGQVDHPGENSTQQISILVNISQKEDVQ
ncbi:hypothetical protein ARMGADRAFT_1066703 [Armillaria gallica]|uniref:Uncharacterized protein n=1 Tax=Armillaria gallica TaxID=47427 RepID=A0A2H3CW37_ARMGA|nr:hypothetical protein ARMGADRAFT_1066703 [Armillaria gallica]